MSHSEPEFIYRHDCPALGPGTILPRAFMADKTAQYVLFYQHKCPFCNQTGGEREYAKGVTPAPGGGYYIDEKIAEKLY